MPATPRLPDSTRHRHALRGALATAAALGGLLLTLASAPVHAAVGTPGTAPVAGEAARALVGTWRWSREGDQCTETYEYRADGTGSITSRDERSLHRYRLSAQPSMGGFYTLTSEVLRDYGGKDCAELDEDDTGRTYTLYLLMSTDRDAHLLCYEQSQQRCFGPLRRVLPGSASVAPGTR
jgi:hypothetical protein